MNNFAINLNLMRDRDGLAIGCATVALSRPPNDLTAPIAATTATLLRVATDPLLNDYYWIPVGVAAVALLLWAPNSNNAARTLTQVAAYLAWAAAPLALGPLGALACAGLLVGGLVLAHRAGTHHPVAMSARVRSVSGVRPTSGSLSVRR